MNYRHAFHAGNHADVLKHVVLLTLCEALTAKAAPCFALDTHAGRGLYRLAGAEALRSGEAQGGIERLAGGGEPPLARYLAAIAACRHVHGEDAYPGSPWLIAHALRDQDRIACCELEPGEHAVLKANFTDDPRVATHARDGYAAMRALLPPRLDGQRFARGLVLVDPPYEAQLAEFDLAIAALRQGLERWPQATYALWYPVKRRRDLASAYRGFADLPARAALRCELLVRSDDSPLRMNGSGLLLLNPPWRLDETLARTLPVLQAALGEADASCRVDWLRPPP